MPPEETRELQQAVTHARERLDDLKPLLQVANQLDHSADVSVMDNGDEEGSAA